MSEGVLEYSVVPFHPVDRLNPVHLIWMKQLETAGISSWIILELYERWGFYVDTPKFQHMIEVLCNDDQKYGLGKIVLGRDFISSDHDIATLLLYLQFPVATLLEIQTKFAVDFTVDGVKKSAIGLSKLALTGLVVPAATIGGTLVYYYHYLTGYTP